MFGRKPITININNNFNLGEEIMARLDELLAKIETIAIGNTAEIQAEVDEIKAALAANTQTIADNGANDEITKNAVAENTQLIDALVAKLGASTPTA